MHNTAFVFISAGRDGTDGRNGIPGIHGIPGRQGLPGRYDTELYRPDRSMKSILSV